MVRKPRQERAKATVDSIVQAAIELVASHGVGFLTTAKVADRAGVSVGSLYEYFDNKEQIQLAASERLAEEAAATMRPWVVELVRMPARDAVYELLLRMRAFVERDKGLYLMFIRNSMANGQTFNLEVLESTLRDMGMQYMMHHPEMARVENLAAKLYVVIHGGVYAYINHLADPAPPVSFEELANALADMVANNAKQGVSASPD